MINAAVFVGNPISFQNKFNIYPPTIGDVLMPSFTLYQSILLITRDDLLEMVQKEGKDIEPPTPFQFLFINAQKGTAFQKVISEGLTLFLKQPVTFLFEKNVIVVGEIKDMVANAVSIDTLPIIDESNYFDFQNKLREVMGMQIEEKFEDDPNLDPRIKRMKEKARLRDRIKAKKGNQSNNLSMTAALASLCCRGIGLTPFNIKDLPYASLNLLMNMCSKKEKYEIDIRSLQAGADKKKVHPAYWITDKD